MSIHKELHILETDDHVEFALWKIAKKFRSTVEDIARVNGIEDENKIYVGQQLYIPKYIKKRIAVKYVIKLMVKI